jgi:hypothetical protein
MRRTRWFLPCAALAAAFALGSCGERTTLPLSPPISGLPVLGDGLGGLTLLACSPLPADTGSAVIGPAGGTIDVGPHHFSVPAGALDSAVLITAIAPSGTVNRVQFAPDGLQFARSATLTMSYANCDALTWLLPRRVVQVDGTLDILDVLPSLNDFRELRVSAKLDHFSDYAVAW